MRTLSDAVEKRRVVEIEYLKEGEETPDDAVGRAVHVRARAPVWRVHTWDRTADGPRTYRLDRMRSARLTDERFEPAAGLRPQLPQRAAHGPALALAGRRTLEARARRAPPHRQGRHLRPARTRRTSGFCPRCSADGGETVVLEPADARATVAARAKALQQELGLSAAPEAAGSTSLNVAPLTGARLHLHPAPVRERDRRARPRGRGPSPATRGRGADAGLEDAEQLVRARCPRPRSAIAITTSPASCRAVTVTAAPAGRVPDGVVDEVVECLPQPRRRRRRPESPSSTSASTGAPAERGRVDRVPDERGEVDPRRASSEPGVRVGEEPLDARRGRRGELEQPPPAPSSAVGVALGDRRERRHRAPQLVREHPQRVALTHVLRHSTQRPGGCAAAQRAASASIGSSLAAQSSTSGRASAAPELPAA